MKTKFWPIQVNNKTDRKFDKITHLAHDFGEGDPKIGRNSAKLI